MRRRVEEKKWKFLLLLEIFIVAFVLNEFLGADDQGEEENFFIDI